MRPLILSLLLLAAPAFGQTATGDLGLVIERATGLRLEQAQWLRTRGLPVAEVARRTGYRSPSALTAALRRREPALRDDAPAPRTAPIPSAHCAWHPPAAIKTAHCTIAEV